MASKNVEFIDYKHKPFTVKELFKISAQVNSILAVSAIAIQVVVVI